MCGFVANVIVSGANLSRWGCRQYPEGDKTKDNFGTKTLQLQKL